LTAIMITVVAAIPAVVVPVVVSHGHGTPTKITNPCVTNPQSCE
jgi:hypothetical protein